MSKKIILIFYVTILLLFLKPLHAVETEIITAEGVVIHFEKSLRSTANMVVDIYPDVKAQLEETLGFHVNFRPTVMIVKGGETFQKISNSSLVVAVAISQKNLIVIDSSKANTHPFSLETTMKHELCHLMLHNITGGNLPKWLNEGISQWASGGIAEVIIGEKKDRLKQATLTGRYISLEDITESFPEDKNLFILAYEESKSLVEYIIREFGTGGLLQVLHHLKNGDKIDEAILKGLSISLEELEGRWQDHLRRKFTWFRYLSHNLYPFLFFISALILIYGFLRFLIRKWTYRDEDEDDIAH